MSYHVPVSNRRIFRWDASAPDGYGINHHRVRCRTLQAEESPAGSGHVSLHAISSLRVGCSITTAGQPAGLVELVGPRHESALMSIARTWCGAGMHLVWVKCYP